MDPVKAAGGEVFHYGRRGNHTLLFPLVKWLLISANVLRQTLIIIPTRLLIYYLSRDLGH